MLTVAARTGLRNAEIRSLRRSEVVLGLGAHVRCTGKGSKTRCTPFRRDVVAVICPGGRSHRAAPTWRRSRAAALLAMSGLPAGELVTGVNDTLLPPSNCLIKQRDILLDHCLVAQALARCKSCPFPHAVVLGFPHLHALPKDLVPPPLIL